MIMFMRTSGSRSDFIPLSDFLIGHSQTTVVLNITANLIYLRICPYEATAGSVYRRLVFFGFWLIAIQPTSNFDMVVIPLKKTKCAVR